MDFPYSGDGAVSEEEALKFAPEIDALREHVSANTSLVTTGGGCLAIEVVLDAPDDDEGSGSYAHILVTDKDDGTLSDTDTDGYLVGVYYKGNTYGEDFDTGDYRDAPRTPLQLVEAVEVLQQRAGLA